MTKYKYGRPKGQRGRHRMRRNARIEQLATLHDIPESTVVGRGLHRRPQRAAEMSATQPIEPQAYRITLEELGLQVRASERLLRERGLTTVGLIMDWSEEQLLDIRGFGQKSLDELKAKLAAPHIGLTLKSEKATALTPAA